ncbi:peptide transporter family 1 isoform X2 [Aethina tumida]|uniref:peptide transporter family 1 isoform X2 n=1 Tax=Aethina tumida TaxID=116153 RepID=UPI002148B64A|nr:peptide transporter family 1 isoform X2 [Aethina tumida]
MEREKKLPYPKSVFFIVSNEFCERFSYYGMRTILILYLKNILLFSEADSKIIYHTFTMFVYFFPLLGAILSDSWLGKFKTIFFVSIIYACGSILLAVSSAPTDIPQTAFSMIGLLLIALGTGGIKPCVSAFGGDQFILPQQELQLATFFSLFYFSINSGSLVSTFLTPILREKVHCFGDDHCYPLAFAVPGALMVVSIIIFGLGKPLYRIKKPEGNVFVQVTKCISYAISKKSKRDKSEKPKEHWLDYASDKYDSTLIDNIKATIKVLIIYIPLPIFWALYDQQGSGWTFQAVRMDGDIGFYTILPDQMQVVNPLLILAFIPLFTYVVYPLLAKCNFVKTPLQRMAAGGVLTAVAFGISACISLWLESTYPTLPSEGNIQLRMYNPTKCDVTVNALDLRINSAIKSFGYEHNIDIDFSGKSDVEFTFTGDCLTEKTLKVSISEETAYGIVIQEDKIQSYEDDIKKSDDGNPIVRTLQHVSTGPPLSYGSKNIRAENIEQETFDVGTYDVGPSKTEMKLKLGGKYVVIANDEKAELITVTEPNSVHILWLLPQYIVITGGEIMFAITGLEFSYSQAPVSMKSVLQACWLLTTAFGNLIIVIIESGKIFDKQSYDFFLYTVLMLFDMALFIWLATKYKYISFANSEQELTTTDKEKQGVENSAFDDSN